VTTPAESIRRFGFTNPVLIDGENRILAGHGRVEAARQLGIAAAPCLRVDHLSQAEKRAHVLADNKIALNAGWDEELLALELKEMMETDIEFDVSVIGFSIAEVDQLVEGRRHVATQRARADDKGVRIFMRPRRPRATCSSPRRGARGGIELT
jgi:ParB-like chromosome segregation protein Spo0J